MAVERFLRMLFGFKEIKFRLDDDFFDRLSRRHSVYMLLLFSFIITTKQYIGEPIYCWAPATFTDAHKHYTNNVCWVTNTYHVPWDENLPGNNDSKKMVSYYQWVPLILIFQAVLCYYPSILWKYFCRRSGINVQALMEAGLSCQKTQYVDIRKKTIKYIVNQVDQYLTSRQRREDTCYHRLKILLARYCCFFYGKVYGNYLSICYIVVKLLYVCNSIGQIFLLDVLLGAQYSLYGMDVMKRFYRSEDWTFSPMFPRVTMCNFFIRFMNQKHTYVVQCVLPINLFNEKIFIFIWFWFAIVSILTIISFLKWTWTIALWPMIRSYIFTLLNNIGIVSNKHDKKVIDRFLQRYLKRDGVFILRLLGNNMGGLVSMEVLNGLWENFEREFGTGVVSPDKNISTFKRRSRKNVQKANIRLNSLADDIEPV